MGDNINVLEILNRPFSADQIQQRQGGGNGRVVSYVGAAFVKQRLNEAFGHVWDWIIVKHEIRENTCYVLGELVVTINGTIVKKQGFGGQVIHGDVSDAFKGASSDALKVAASLLGIGLHMYLERPLPQQSPQKAQRTQYQSPQQQPQRQQYAQQQPMYAPVNQYQQPAPPPQQILYPQSPQQQNYNPRAQGMQIYNPPQQQFQGYVPQEQMSPTYTPLPQPAPAPPPPPQQMAASIQTPPTQVAQQNPVAPVTPVTPVLPPTAADIIDKAPETASPVIDGIG